MFKETHNHVKSHSKCDVLADGDSLIAIPNCIHHLICVCRYWVLKLGFDSAIQAMFDNQSRIECSWDIQCLRFTVSFGAAQMNKKALSRCLSLFPENLLLPLCLLKGTRVLGIHIWNTRLYLAPWTSCPTSKHLRSEQQSYQHLLHGMSESWSSHARNIPPTLLSALLHPCKHISMLQKIHRSIILRPSNLSVINISG
jgi:hypothetical protein